jgi:hypothetical protein
MTVERRIGAQQHARGGVAPAQRPDGGQSIADQSLRPAGRVDRPLAQPLRHDHRRGGIGCHGGQQGVEAPHPGVAEPGALLRVTVDLDDRVVNVDQHPALDAGQQRSAPGKPGQQPRGDRVELADVTEAQRPQKRPQRRRRVRPVEDAGHRAVPQQRHVIDRVGTGNHPGHQRHDFPTGVRALVRRNRQPLTDQVGQPDRLRQPRDRDQPSGRHQIRLVEPRSEHRAGMRESHLRDALREPTELVLQQAQFCCRARAFSRSDAPNRAPGSVDRG